MKRLLDLQPAEFIHDPIGSWTIVFDSFVRNATAEALFYIQLFVALLIGLAFDLIRKRDLGARYETRGAQVDGFYGLLEITHVVHFCVLLPVGLYITRWLEWWAPWLRVESLSSLPHWQQILILIVFTDFCVYWWHRAQHQSRIAWQFHKTHHSQENITVMTTFRSTIVDRVVALAILAVPAAAMQVDATLPVVIAAALQFHQLIIHSDTGLSLGPFERIFVSPSFHEVHHSSLEPHIDRNFGGVLAIWDHMFGTYAPRGNKELRYGLVGERLPEAWLKQQAVPFVGLWQLYRERRQ